MAQPSLVQLVGMMVTQINPKNWFENDAPVSGNVRPRPHHRHFPSSMSPPMPKGFPPPSPSPATSRDPNKAALIANTLADAYVRSQVATKVNATTATTTKTG